MVSQGGLAINSSSLIKCCLFNSRSICNKITDLDFYLRSTSPALACITETWLKPDILDNFVSCSGSYSVSRTDRQFSPGGGVCILCKDDVIKASAVTIPDKFRPCEIVCIDIVDSSVKIRVICGYRPPGHSADKDVKYMLLFVDCLNFLCNVNSTVLLCGDFNLPKIRWLNGLPCQTVVDTCSDLFINFMYDFALRQHVQEDTRLSRLPDKAGNILDLVLSNDASFVFNVKADVPFSTSDHLIVNFDIFYHSKGSTDDSKPHYNFLKADWASIESYLSEVDFYSVFSSGIHASDCASFFTTRSMIV